MKSNFPLGNRIKEARQLRGLTQVKLAHLCEFEKSSLSRMETGKTNLKVLTLKKIADVMGISVRKDLMKLCTSSFKY